MSFTVLIVDDDPKDLKLVERLLQKENLILKTFSSPIEALAEFDKVKVDLVISDRKMPHMDGTDFLKRVKEKYPDCYCILISGSPISTTEENALAQGKIEYFFPKPLTAELFLSTINRLLNLEKQ